MSQQLPGQSFSGETYSPDQEWLLSNPGAYCQKSVPIDPASRDAANTPTTTLAEGLLMGIVTATKKWKQYDNGANDGTEVCAGILLHPVKLIDPLGAAVVSPVVGTVVMAQARIRSTKVHGAAGADLAAAMVDLKAVGHGFIDEAAFE